MYLKENVIAEPYIWQWYAWPHLIAPMTAAANITKRYIRIMESFIACPELHSEALKISEMIGGPFLSCMPEQHIQIENLLRTIQNKCKSLIKLSNDIDYLQNLLQENVNGNSLNNFYDNLPSSLRGKIELVYDMNNSASIRFIEQLIYSNFYDTSEQMLSIYLTDSDKRNFILSTPYLQHNNKKDICAKIPFSSDALLQFYSMTENGGIVEEMYEKLNIDSDLEHFKKLFTGSKQFKTEYKEYEQVDIVRVRYFGHACILLQIKGLSILIDPIISYAYPTNIERYTYQDLPDKIDYVLITHSHQDHICLETLLKIKHKIGTIIVPNNNKGFIADPSLKLILKHCGFSNIITLNEFEEIIIENGCIKGVPFLGEHADLNIHSKLAYYINIMGNTFLFAVDSNNLDSELYRYIFSELGSVDNLFIGMECEGAPLSWLYGPLYNYEINKQIDESRRLAGSNSDKAWKLTQFANCANVFVYAMGQEPWLSHIMGLNYSSSSPQILESDIFVNKCIANDINAKRLFGKEEWHYKKKQISKVYYK